MQNWLSGFHQGIGRPFSEQLRAFSIPFFEHADSEKVTEMDYSGKVCFCNFRDICTDSAAHIVSRQTSPTQYTVSNAFQIVQLRRRRSTLHSLRSSRIFSTGRTLLLAWLGLFHFLL